MRCAVAVAAALLAAAPARACGEGGVPCVMDGQALVESVGVVTHFVDPSTPYAANAGLVLARLLEAHIHHIRDGARDVAGQIDPGDHADLFRVLAQSGVGIDFITRLGLAPGFLRAFRARVAPAAELFEMANEANDGHDPDWIAHLRAALTEFRRQADGTPVIGPSLILLSAGQPGDNAYAALGEHAAAMDFGNVHDYPGGFHPGSGGWGNHAAPPCQDTRYGGIAFNLCEAAALSGAKPIMATEYGWSTDIPRQPAAVPEAIQGRYLPRGLLLQAMAGIRRTYIYQLVDSGADGGGAMGMLRADFSPKPAFGAVAALLALADDSGPGRAAPTVRLTGDLQDVRCIVLRRADGPSRLVAWVEALGYDPNARHAVPVAAHRVSVTTPARIGLVRTLGDDGRAVPQPGSTELALTDRLTVVDLE